jgi:hypothetical protein
VRRRHPQQQRKVDDGTLDDEEEREREERSKGLAVELRVCTVCAVQLLRYVRIMSGTADQRKELQWAEIPLVALTKSAAHAQPDALSLALQTAFLGGDFP